MMNRGRTVIPSGLAESESNQSPPSRATTPTVARLAERLAYTISGGSKSICTPTSCRTPLNAASQNTARKAATTIKMLFSQFMLLLVGRVAFRVSSFEPHPHFLNRVEICPQFHARHRRQAVLDRASIENLSNGD